MKKNSVGLFKKTLTYLILIIISIIMIFPFVYLVSLSLQSTQEATSLPPTIWPDELKFDNFTNALNKAPLFLYLKNSLIFGVVSTGLVVFTAVFTAYAITKIKFPGRNFLTMFFISTLLVPPAIRVVPLYQIVADLGWVNTWAGMILPVAATGFTIHFMRQYFVTIPDAVVEAARIDGASEFGIITKIMMPMSKPAIGTIVLFNFLFRWNDYIWPLVITRPSHRTLTVGLTIFKTSENLIRWNEIGAASLLLFIPSFFVYLFLHKYLMERGKVSKSGVFR